MNTDNFYFETRNLLGFRLFMDNGGSHEAISSKISAQPQPKINEINGLRSQKIGSKISQPQPKIT